VPAERHVRDPEHEHVIGTVELHLVGTRAVTEREVASAEHGLAAVLGTAAALAVLAITALLGEVFYTGAVTATLTHAHDGRPPTLHEVARSIRYGRLIVVDLLYGVIDPRIREAQAAA